MSGRHSSRPLLLHSHIKKRLECSVSVDCQNKRAVGDEILVAAIDDPSAILVGRSRSGEGSVCRDGSVRNTHISAIAVYLFAPSNVNVPTIDPFTPVTSSVEPKAKLPDRLPAPKFGVVVVCNIRNPDVVVVSANPWICALTKRDRATYGGRGEE